MQGEMSRDERSLRNLVDPATFDRGRPYAFDGSVRSHRWQAQGQQIYGEVAGGGPIPYTTWVRISRASNGDIVSFQGNCTCPVHLDCKHSVALAIAALAEEAREQESVPARPTVQAWELPLRALLREDRTARQDDEASPVALQFEIVDGSRSYRTGLSTPTRIGMRPVTRGLRGGWIRSGISWQNLAATWSVGTRAPREQIALLMEIVSMDQASRPSYYSNSGQLIYLDGLATRRIWTVLADARAAELPFVTGTEQYGSVRLVETPAEVRIEARRNDGTLSLRPRISVGDQHPDPDEMLLLGSPAHGVAWWGTDDEDGVFDTGDLRLAPLGVTIDPVVRGLLDVRQLLVPPADEARFFSAYYPMLQQRVPVVPIDDAVILPEPEPPVLVLEATAVGSERIDLDWHWRYVLGESSRREPLWPVASPNESARSRELELEAVVVKSVDELLGDLPGLRVRVRDGERLAHRATLTGVTALRFAGSTLEQLETLAGVVVERHGDFTDYREATDAPVVAIDASKGGAERDWLDLAVTVTVDGETVPFDRLFVALASRNDHLILPSGTWFTLDRPELVALTALIEEARAINDPGPETLRVSRFQVDLWEELDRLGVISGQAEEWRAAMSALGDVSEIEDLPTPPEIGAVLRPYQSAGFSWLAFLHQHGLGGVLADEMGLGKTLQAISLICRVRALGETRPFLVVAPTSVAYNWSAECAHFAPSLNVAMIGETARRSGRTVADQVAGADIVVTSYALFRIEYDDYETVPWAGLILDEAQFVKNPKSRAYRCAKLLPAPFKLAITGTPMENNLLELWSLLSITAPGLFPRPSGFEQHYRRPIERDNDHERLAQLRRRIKPLMLRRTKEQVATDLPDKQEQVMELPLNPKHRRVYDTYLQRERQKVLGLLGDLERNRFEIFRSLTLLRLASLDPGLLDPRYSSIPSTKLDALMELLTEISSEGHRTLVFSQFTRFLGSARQRLDEAGIAYSYLDGKTRRRPEVIEAFKTGTDPVFLISLKAGGFGLNLTEADYCVLLDPWWNPAAEAQAVDRVHRIGQTRNVMVYRLVARDTIEEKVMALKAQKAALFDSVMADGDVAARGLTAADIRGMLE